MPTITPAWIKCPEQLPDINIPVLVYNAKWTKSGKPGQITFGMRIFGIRNTWHVLGIESEELPTHWMYFPDPPKE